MPVLRDVLNAQQTALLTSGKVNRVFATQNKDTGTYVADTTCWMHPHAEALTCRAVDNTWGGYWGGPTLIHPRFAVTAWHFWLSSPGVVGRKAHFRATDGTLYERTVQAQARIGTTDIGLVMFDTVLPSAIVPAKLWPVNYRHYLRPRSDYRVAAYTYMATQSSTTLRVPVRDVYHLDEAVYTTNPLSSDARLPWAEAPSLYGSGSPLFCLVDGQAVLLGCWYGVDVCPHLTHYAAEIEAAMTAMAGSAQTVARVSLDDYDTQPPHAQLTASPQSGPTGTQVLLMWTTDGTTATLNGESVSPLGSRTVTISDTTYTVVNTGPYGTATASVMLDELVAPTITFTADSYTVPVGGTTTLRWTVTDASEVTISGLGSMPLTGEQEVTITQNTVFTLDATNEANAQASLLIRAVGSNGGATLATIYSIVGSDPEVQLDWFDTGTWVGGVVPGEGDAAIISANSNVALVLEEGSATIFSTIDIYGTLTIGNEYGTLSFDAEATITVREGGTLYAYYVLFYNNVIGLDGSMLTINNCTFDRTIDTSASSVMLSSDGNIYVGVGIHRGYASLGYILVVNTSIMLLNNAEFNGELQGMMCILGYGALTGGLAGSGILVCYSGSSLAYTGELPPTMYPTVYRFPDAAFAEVLLPYAWRPPRHCYMGFVSDTETHVQLGLASGPVMYASNDPAVAPPDKVLAGTSNLGVPGTLDISATVDAAKEAQLAQDRTTAHAVLCPQLFTKVATP